MYMVSACKNTTGTHRLFRWSGTRSASTSISECYVFEVSEHIYLRFLIFDILPPPSLPAHGNTTLSYMIEQGICYLTLADKGYPKRLAFLYLEEIHQEFEQELRNDYGDEWRNKARLLLWCWLSLLVLVFLSIISSCYIFVIFYYCSLRLSSSPHYFHVVLLFSLFLIYCYHHPWIF